MLRHAALNVETLELNRSFYEEVLGFRPYHVGDPDWLMLEREGTTLSLVSNHPKHPAHLGFVARSQAEVDAMHEHVMRLAPNARASAPKSHRDGSYGFYFQDPSGNALEYIFIPALASRPDRTLAEGLGVMLLTDSAVERSGALQSLIEELTLGLRGVPFEVASLQTGSFSALPVLAGLVSVHRIKVVRVVPCFLPGEGPQAVDVEIIVRDLQAAHPEVRVELMPGVIERPLVRSAIVTAVAESVLYGAPGVSGG